MVIQKKRVSVGLASRWLGWCVFGWWVLVMVSTEEAPDPVDLVLGARVEAGLVRIEDRFDGRETKIEAAALVDCGHRAPLDDTADGPKAGDAVAPRSIYEAILEGRAAALALSAA